MEVLDRRFDGDFEFRGFGLAPHGRDLLEDLGKGRQCRDVECLPECELVLTSRTREARRLAAEDVALLGMPSSSGRGEGLQCCVRDNIVSRRRRMDAIPEQVALWRRAEGASGNAEREAGVLDVRQASGLRRSQHVVE